MPAVSALRFAEALPLFHEYTNGLYDPETELLIAPLFPPEHVGLVAVNTTAGDADTVIQSAHTYVLLPEELVAVSVTSYVPAPVYFIF